MKDKNLHIRLPEKLHENFSGIAAKYSVNKSDLIRDWIKSWTNIDGKSNLCPVYYEFYIECEKEVDGAIEVAFYDHSGEILEPVIGYLRLSNLKEQADVIAAVGKEVIYVEVPPDTRGLDCDCAETAEMVERRKKSMPHSRRYQGARKFRQAVFVMVPRY